ncbi:thiopeptide-type bacteriocin biosynthesis protein [Carnobacteriaceae bacterium zg-ZUI78]|nr:thiopeptide-type bacteriocin biosynthesis protein [Carnobacteriaceae bacterium zg-ZUI78]
MKYIHSEFDFRRSNLPINICLRYSRNHLLIDLTKNKKLYEMIFSSSPDLISSIESYSILTDKSKSKVNKSLLNYVNRMGFRTTPYGTLSSVGMGNFSKNLSFIPNDFIYHLSIDMGWLLKFIKKIEYNKVFFPFFKLTVTSSKKKEKNRYLFFNIVSDIPTKVVIANKVLDLIIELSENPISSMELVEKIVWYTGYSFDEVNNYICDLLHEGILLSNLTLNTPFLKTLDKLIIFFEELPLECFEKKLIEQIKYLISEYNSALIPEKRIDILISLTKIMKNYIEHDKYWHIDSIFKEQMLMSNDYKKIILKIANIFEHFFLYISHKKIFSKIYSYFEKNYNDNDEVPILDFIYSPLSLLELDLNLEDNFNMYYSQKSIQYIEQRIDETIENNEGVLILNKEDLKILENSQVNIDRYNYDLVLHILKTDNNIDKYIISDSLSGASFGKLMGRFYYLFPESEFFKFYKNDLLNDKDENMEFVEVSSVSKFDLANNLCLSKQILEKEICISTLGDKKINISDLLVGKDEDMLYLKDQKINKIIIPKFHHVLHINKLFDRLHKFLYLIQLQHDSVRGVVFSFLNKKRKYIPRIEYEDIILYRARYFINNIILGLDDNFSFNDFKKMFIIYKDKYFLSDIVGVLNGDDIQYMSMYNETSLIYLYKLLVKFKEIELVEFPYLDNIVQDTFYTEYIFHVIQNTSVKNISHNTLLIKENADCYSQFVDKVVYFKVYIRIEYIADFLNLFLTQVFKHLKSTSVFYVLYADPIFHIRIRIINLNENEYYEVYQTINHLLKIIGNEIYLENIITEKMIPETNRYGGTETFSLILNHFCYETFFISRILCTEENKLYVLIKLIYFILDFFFEDEQKRNLTKIMSRGKIDISIKLDSLNNLELDKEKIYDYFFNIDNIITKMSENLRILSTMDFKTNLKINVIKSIIHMTFNRFSCFFNLKEIEIYKIIYLILNKEKYLKKDK